MKTITVKSVEEGIADYHSLKKRIIKDKNPKRKRGVSDYWIEAYLWDGEREFTAVIDACWFTETVKSFDNLREASQFIRHSVY